MIKEAIVKIVNKEDLTYNEAYTVMNEIMNGETTPTQNAAFLAALSTKSAKAETTDEIAGCAAAMRNHAVKVTTDMELMEIVGTGGDNAHSFNISTTSALVAAAGGVPVSKHGNRAASSLYGHKKVYFVAGKNKVSPDFQSALHRLRNVVAPKNAQRLGRKTPCAAKGDRCYNCNSPERICRGLVVHYRKMNSMDMEVVLIDQELGY